MKESQVIVLANSKSVVTGIVSNLSRKFSVNTILADTDDIERIVSELKSQLLPDQSSVVVHALEACSVGIVSEGETLSQDTEYKINVDLTREIAALCFAQGAHLIYWSSDQLFDSDDLDVSFNEEILPIPANWYGKTKYLAEREVVASGVEYTIVRTGPLLSGDTSKTNNLLTHMAIGLDQGTLSAMPVDQQFTPLDVRDLATAITAIINDLGHARNQVFHLGSDEAISPYEIALRLQGQLESPTQIDQMSYFDRPNVSGESDNQPAMNSSLNNSLFKSTYGIEFTPLDNSIADIAEVWMSR